MKSNKYLIILYVIYLLMTTAFSYHIIYNKTVEDFKEQIFDNLGRLAILTSEFIDKGSLSYIIDYVENNDIDIEFIESTKEFKTLQNQLLFLNSIYPNISSWSYIYYPTNDLNTVLFLIYTDTEGVKFGDEYDISPYPSMLNSIKDKSRTYIEKEVTYDQGFDVWVTSAFSPIYKDDKYLGHLGIDMFIEDFENNLYNIRVNALLLAIAVVFIGGIFLPQILYKIYLYFANEEFKALLKKRKLRKSIKKAIKKAIRENK